MVLYNCMQEAWIDTDDDTFNVDMTPSMNVRDEDLEFCDQAAFWVWYNGE